MGKILDFFKLFGVGILTFLIIAIFSSILGFLLDISIFIGFISTLIGIFLLGFYIKWIGGKLQ